MKLLEKREGEGGDWEEESGEREEEKDDKRIGGRKGLESN